MAPTRELAQQIAIVYKFLGEYLKVKVHVFIGGTQVRNDVKNIIKPESKRPYIGPIIVPGKRYKPPIEIIIVAKKLIIFEIKNNFACFK